MDAFSSRALFATFSGVDDAALVEFEAVMRDNGPRIYTLAIRLTGRETDGSDLAQETFIKAWEHWTDFRKEADAGTWLYRICVNLWKNRVRYEKRRSFWKHDSLTENADDEKPMRELAAAEPPLGMSLEKAQEQDQLQQALNKLESHDRAILLMRDVEDQSYDVIAAVLKLPLGTVKSRLARAREKLTLEFSRISA